MKRAVCTLLLSPVVLLIPRFLPPAQALPSFAQQTGLECTACHIGGFGPQLTPRGQKFKIDGYTDKGGSGTAVPFAAMLVGSGTHTDKSQPGGAGPHQGPNDNAVLQETSVFVAGAFTEHLGSFSQATYSDIERKISWDQVDLRYAVKGKVLDQSGTFGVDLNNNPTVQDPFNTLAVWGFPYEASELAPTPAASPLISGGLEHQVAGLSAYAYLNNKIYAEVGAYRSLSHNFLTAVGQSEDAGHIREGVAPYWRLAYTGRPKAQYYSLGLSGMHAALRPLGASGGSTDTFDDVGVDGSYQYLGTRKHIVTLNSSLVHEWQKLDASFAGGDADHRHNTLESFNLNAAYYYRNTYGITAGAFDTWGSRDKGLYAPGDVSGSRNGKPNSNGVMAQVDFTPFGSETSFGAPWLNLRVGLQYTAYTEFNGASRDYDGSGRDASDNNTLFGFLWSAF